MGLLIVEEKSKTRRECYEEEVKTRCESIPDHKIDPYRGCHGQLRIERTLTLLESEIKIEGCCVADIGCGSGRIAEQLVSKGGQITCVDAANRLKSPIPFLRATLPYLPLSDSSFDGVVFTDVIAELEPELYRITLSELSRLLKKEGWFLCSTPLDTHSHDASERFISLLETEFEIVAATSSFHRLHLAIIQGLKAPFRFRRGGEDASYRLQLLQKRSGVARLWFYLNTIKAIAWFWRGVAPVFRPLLELFQKNRKLLHLCESLSKILWRSSGLTHLIVLARKRKIQ